MHKRKKIKLVQACSVRANLTSWRVVYLFQDKKRNYIGIEKWFHNKYAKHA